MPELPKTYNPQEVEREIYQRWEASGLFNPDKLPLAKRRKPFTISMPPSNITGELHIGHALGFTIQDLLIRYRRMRGLAALWLPGTDHAAIATQVVVDRELRKEGISRHEIGRDKFLDHVWKWKEKYGQRIVEQTKRLGASADWSRERFTMDADLTLAVNTAFKRLYDDGLIYRGERITNWCPACQTSISDLEVDHEDVPGKLWYIKYPLTDGSGHITVATTRPETMLGDTAVAVHPSDARFAGFARKTVRLPIVERDIPVIVDAKIDREFGTGAVKVTPGHDVFDFELGLSHHLPIIRVIGFDGRMLPAAGRDFVGLTVLEARQRVVEKLRELGAMEKEEEYIHPISVCSRSKTVIEPLISKQWFVKVKPLAEKAIRAVRSGKIKIVPERFAKTYFQWMENIHDWNISRQIWWGHRLPVWYRNEGPDQLNRGAISYHNAIVDEYVRAFATPDEIDVPVVRSLHKYFRGQRVLDFGCGPGLFTDEIRKLGGAVKGIDASSKMIERARQDYSKTIFEQGDFFDVGRFGTGTHDTVFSFYTLGYVGRARAGNLLKRWASLLRTGGHLVLAVPIGPARTHVVPSPLKRGAELRFITFTRPEITAHLKKAGFSVVSYRERNKLVAKELVKKAYIVAKKIQSVASDDVYVGVRPPPGIGWTQDTDTLDTWFSSGLWTFSTLGWPKNTADLRRHHPTDVLETAWDILFFWVARMIMFSLYFLDEVPFKTVYLHGLVLDEHGKKMSKSKGTGIDPLVMSDKYGTDALRMSLIIGNAPGQDFRLYEKKVEGYRNFANKLWNVARFILAHERPTKKASPITLADKWILSRLAVITADATADIESFDFSGAGQTLYDFVWHDFADWYLEASKIHPNAGVLYAVLDTVVRLLHPFMPFVTEALWSTIRPGDMLLGSSWPKIPAAWLRGKKEAELFVRLQHTVVALRNFRAHSGLPSSAPCNYIAAAPFDDGALLRSLSGAAIRPVTRLAVDSRLGEILLGDIKFQMELVYIDRFRAWRDKERVELNKYIAGIKDKLGNERFVASAPAEMVEAERAKLAAAEARLLEI